MKKVHLTMLQRFGLENLLGEQRGNREANIVFHRIRKKIKVPADTREKIAELMKTRGDAAFDNQPEATIELETEEVRKLRKLCEEAELPVAALEWVEPLMEQLEAK
jgi:hypothetical protein